MPGSGSKISLPNSGEEKFGRRLIPTLIDEKASIVPEETYCFVPLTSTIEHGFRPITFRCLTNAINACAWWLEATVGKGQNFGTLAYLAPSDLRNIIIIIAAIKTGHKALLASPRNRLQAHLSLLENTQCHLLLTADPPSQSAQEILEHRSMRHVLVPEADHWLNAPVVDHYPYSRTFDEARHEPFVVVHTSGSTGLPKVVVVNHGTVAASDAFNNRSEDGECGRMVLEIIRNKRCYVSMPSFHIAGIDFMLAKAFFQGIVPVLSPPAIPVTAELVDAMHRLEVVELSVVAPSILQDIASSPVFLGNLRHLSATIYGGGPLPPSAGAAITARTRLYNFMGSSEMANVPTEEIDPQDWEYLKFSSKLGYEMRHHSGDLFELCFVRQPHLELFQSIFSTFPDREDYCTSDLYSGHPTKRDLWKYQGRADDIITLTNSEKVNPVPMEKMIEAHPAVRSVLVVGQARFQTALLVEAKEPLSSGAESEAVIEDLWITIEKANIHCDSHARISRGLIVFTSPQKPFLRAGKGTVQRRMTVDSYNDEINKLYNDFGGLARPIELHSAKMNSSINPQTLSNAAVSDLGQEDWLHGLICQVTGWPSVDPDADFFKSGMDSLQVLNIVREINAALSTAGRGLESITATTVYSNPTASMLVNACTTSQSSSNSTKPMLLPTQTVSDRMDDFLKKYSWNLPVTRRPPKQRLRGGYLRVLLTGSTGSLGSYILSSLLEDPSVSQIYCFSRSANSEQRQRISNHARGLSTDWSPDRVTFLQGDLSKEYLGLSIDICKYLLENVTHIVHNAWEVNFNLPLTYFEVPHLLGVRQFIDFSARSTNGASILFISSVSSAMNWHLKKPGPVPERIIDDPSVSLPMGYAQSKHLAERLLDRAARVAGIPTIVVRVGQVAGPIKHGNHGCWNKREWLPSLIASSKHMGKIPASLGPNDVVDWIPVDVLGRVLVNLLDSSRMTDTDDVQVNGDGKFAGRLLNGSDTAKKGESNQDAILRQTAPEVADNRSKTTSNSNADAVAHLPINASKHTNSGGEAGQTTCPIGTDSAKVYHAINPNPTTWSTLLPTIQSHFSNIPLEVVPLQEWIDALKLSAADSADVEANPAIRLLDFYQSLKDSEQYGNPVLETRETVRGSGTLGGLEKVRGEWMEVWLEQWGF